MTTRRRLAVVVALTALVGGCRFDGVAFVQDRRVDIVSPTRHERVSEPVTVRWEVEDFTVTGPDGSRSNDAGYFAVLVDRAPQPPGEPLTWFARGDDDCKALPSCPDEQWFTQRGVHTTTETALTLPPLPPPPVSQRDKKEFHDVTIVLLDGHGRRIGESAFTVTFQLVRPTVPR